MTKTARTPLLILVAAVALAAGIALALVQNPQPDAEMVATVFDAPRPLASFALTGIDGQTVSTADLSGQWALLFFGFTTCPDVCPATLGILASTVDKIEPALRPSVYLISVDPERDTPQRLGDYVRYFNSNFQALTGSLADIEALATSLYATFAKVPLDNGDYTMDHFAGIYLVNDRAEVVAISTSPHRAGQLAADYRALRGAR